jgi:large subunit ribosomal protein L29
MDAKELRAKSASELADELLKLRKEQFALRMQRATGQSPKPDQFTKVRRNIARLKTVQREAVLSAGTTTGAAGKTAVASKKR